MPLSTLTSSSVTEIHLLRGGKASQPVREFLRLAHSSQPGTPLTLTQYVNQYSPNLTVSFTPLFIKGTVTGAGPAEVFTGNGMSVNLFTGVVTLDAAAPANEVRNFILAVTADEVNGAVTTSLSHFFRVHIHHDIAHAWLTPNPLSVPRGIDGFRCSTYAEFDDGVIADISGDFTVDFSYTTSPNVIDIGILNVRNSDPDGVNIPLEVTLTYGSPTKSVVATGQMVPYTPSNKLELLAGPGTATLNGTPAHQVIPNVLFIADGFANNLDDNSFDKLQEALRRMMNNIKTPMHAPLDLLLQENAVNIWLACIPSPESTLTYKNELFIKDGFALALPKPDPLKKKLLPMSLAEVLEQDGVTDTPPVDPLKAWTIERMLFILGLPLPAHTAMSPANIRAAWIAQLKLPPALINTIPDARIDIWKQMGDRRLMNERSTLIGAFSGRADRVPFNTAEDVQLFDLQEADRISRDRDSMNALLAGLTFNGTPLGSLWNYSSDPALLGKDYELVCIVLNSLGGRERNTHRYFFMNARTDSNVPNPFAIESDPLQPGTRAFRPVHEKTVFPFSDIPANSLNTFLHETAHSFTLGDEYGENVLTYTGDAASINNRYSNLQAKIDLTLVGGAIDYWKTKWRWHRMDKCRVLNAAITKNSSEYNITLVPLQQEDTSNRFKAGDEVILRFRQYRQPIHGDVLLSPLMKVVADESGDTLKLTVKNFNLYNPLPTGYPLATMVIETAFGKDCILYKPKKAPENALSSEYQYAEVTGLNVIHHMINKNRPLTKEPCVKDENFDQMPDIEDILDLSDTFSTSSCCSCGSKIANRPRIAGLYSGGSGSFCGIFHPTGHCIMRAHELAEFCSVCKYILTEVLHPELHPKVDKYIQEFYPV